MPSSCVVSLLRVLVCVADRDDSARQELRANTCPRQFECPQPSTHQSVVGMGQAPQKSIQDRQADRHTEHGQNMTDQNTKKQSLASLPQALPAKRLLACFQRIYSPVCVVRPRCPQPPPIFSSRSRTGWLRWRRPVRALRSRGLRVAVLPGGETCEGGGGVVDQYGVSPFRVRDVSLSGEHLVF